jgi:OmpA-OmpF porin, OOP family
MRIPLILAAAVLALPAAGQDFSDTELLELFQRQRDAFRAAQSGDLGATRGLKLITVDDLQTKPDLAQSPPVAEPPSGDAVAAAPAVQSEIPLPAAPRTGDAGAFGLSVSPDAGVANATGVAPLSQPSATDGVGVTIAGTTAPDAPQTPAQSAAASEAPIVPVVYGDLPAELTVEMQVTFGFDSATLERDQIPKLAQLCNVMQQSDIGLFRIIGHTDSAGSDAYNERLSLMRAMEVRRYFINECGMRSERLEAIGLGKRFPSVPEDPRAPQNRRVEFQALG